MSIDITESHLIEEFVQAARGTDDFYWIVDGVSLNGTTLLQVVNHAVLSLYISGRQANGERWTDLFKGYPQAAHTARYYARIDAYETLEALF